MFDRASRPTITESVEESADSAVESADYWSRPTGNRPSGYGPLASLPKMLQPALRSELREVPDLC